MKKRIRANLKNRELLQSMINKTWPRRYDQDDMKVIRHYKHTPSEAKGSTITLGNFDGVHKGHKALIEKVVTNAKQHNQPSAVLTFEPHPLSFLKKRNDSFRITEFRNKFQIIESLDVDFLFTLDFNKDLASMEAEEFVKTILVDNLEVKNIIVGHDFIFGKGRSGNAELLKELSVKYDYNFIKIDTITDNEDNIDNQEIFSSTNIRKYIRSGEIEKAANKLGHHFVISGIVRSGQKRGRELGVPTANLDLAEYIRPKFGVYIASAKISEDSGFMPAAVNIGINPTFNENKEVLEAHILDYKGDLYDKYIEIRLLKYLRPEKEFNDIEELKSQMNIDITNVGNYFKNIENK